MTGLAVS